MLVMSGALLTFLVFMIMQTFFRLTSNVVCVKPDEVVITRR
jgi:hypothetical protein